MSEQLWFTWSTFGFGTSGYRIRAASRGFIDARGMVDTQNDRISALMKHLVYTLPLDTIDPSAVSPQDAPISLAFLKAGEERVLVNRTYIGLDGVRRPGNFFSHLITDLPPVQSTCPEGQIPFSAREAIKLWRWNYWKNSDLSVDQGELVLGTVSPLDAGSLSAGDVLQVQAAFFFVIQAFLALPRQGEPKRLYIAAPSNIVATLIWGLTHSLPRTLTIMRDLTFSTYERDITDKTAPVIVGTCWLSPNSQRGIAGIPQDLPPSCYQGDGLAINFYLLLSDNTYKQSPFAHDPLVAKYTEFVLDCFSNKNGHSIGELNTLLNEAERMNIVSVEDFLQLYIVLQDLLKKDAIIRILGSLIPNVEILKRDNVHRSIINLIITDREWWDSSGKREMERIRKSVDSNRDWELATALSSFAIKVADKFQEAIQLNAEGDSFFWWSVFVTSRPVYGSTKASIYLLQALATIKYTEAYQKWWQGFGKIAIETIRSYVDTHPESELVPALTSLAGRAVEELKTAIIQNTSTTLTLWEDVLIASTSFSHEQGAWSDLLQGLAQVGYTQAYYQWWHEAGSTWVKQLRNLANKYPGSTLVNSLSSFARKVATELHSSIISNNQSLTPFWGEVFITTAPLISEKQAWTGLLQGLSQAGYTTAYHQWWERYGKAAIEKILSLAGTPTAGELTNARATLAAKAATELPRAIATSNIETTRFWSDLLSNMAPLPGNTALLANNADVWVKLLSSLSATEYTHTYQQWWENQGRETIKHLRRIADKYAQSDLSEVLSSFAKLVAAKVRSAIERQVQSQDEASILVFWEDVLSISAPISPNLSEPATWFGLLQDLRLYITTPAYQQWWNLQGKEATNQLRHIADTNPSGKTVKALSTYAMEIVNDILKPFNDITKLQTSEQTIFFFLDVLTISTPLSETKVWSTLLQKFPTRMRGSTHVYDTYSWELRVALLQTWGSIPALGHDQTIRPWLEVRWSELGKLFSLPLPPEWYAITITMIIHTQPDIAPHQVVSLLAHYSPLLEDALRSLMDAPATQQEAVNFFDFLAAHGYFRKVPLLAILLVKVMRQQERAEALLKAAHLEPRDVTDFLENYCEQILSQQELPPGLLYFIQQYLYSFNIDNLGSQPTQALLQRLQQRNEQSSLHLPGDLPTYVDGWYKVGDFLEQPLLNKYELRDLNKTIRAIYGMSQLASNTRTKLANKLLPLLIENASTEADLCRVIDNLGRALMGSVTESVGADLLLLEHMAGIVAEQYTQEQPPVRIMTYIKLLLGEARYVPQPPKEKFLGRCLPGLLKHLNQETFDWLDESTKLWPHDVAAEWNIYSDSLRSYIKPEPVMSTPQPLIDFNAIGLTKLNPFAWFKSDQHPQSASSVPENTTPGKQSGTIAKRQEIVASVNGKNITREQFERTCIVKIPYMGYRIAYLRREMQRNPSARADSEKEIVYLQALQANPQQMSEIVRAELIEDLLIEEEITKAIANNIKSSNFNPKKDLDVKDALKDVLKEFKVHQRDSYQILLNMHNIKEQHVKDVLLIFVRRELFAWYLGEHKHMRLDEWLEKRRRNVK